LVGILRSSFTRSEVLLGNHDPVAASVAGDVVPFVILSSRVLLEVTLSALVGLPSVHYVLRLRRGGSFRLRLLLLLLLFARLKESLLHLHNGLVLVGEAGGHGLVLSRRRQTVVLDLSGLLEVIVGDIGLLGRVRRRTVQDSLFIYLLLNLLRALVALGGGGTCDPRRGRLLLGRRLEVHIRFCGVHHRKILQRSCQSA